MGRGTWLGGALQDVGELHVPVTGQVDQEQAGCSLRSQILNTILSRSVVVGSVLNKSGKL